MFQSLGLRIVEGKIYVLGRDQITRLHDLNGDGEADFYENFNNDVHVTSGFHEFAFDLQTDADVAALHDLGELDLKGLGEAGATAVPHTPEEVELEPRKGWRWRDPICEWWSSTAMARF